MGDVAGGAAVSGVWRGRHRRRRRARRPGRGCGRRRSERASGRPERGRRDRARALPGRLPSSECDRPHDDDQDHREEWSETARWPSGWAFRAGGRICPPRSREQVIGLAATAAAHGSSSPASFRRPQIGSCPGRAPVDAAGGRPQVCPVVTRAGLPCSGRLNVESQTVPHRTAAVREKPALDGDRERTLSNVKSIRSIGSPPSIP